MSRGGSFAAQFRCGSSRMRAPFAPPRLSVPRKVEAEAHAARTRSATESPEARIFALSDATSLAFTSSCAAGGTGSCQMSDSFGTSGPR